MTTGRINQVCILPVVADVADKRKPHPRRASLLGCFGVKTDEVESFGTGAYRWFWLGLIRLLCSNVHNNRISEVVFSTHVFYLSSYKVSYSQTTPCQLGANCVVRSRKSRTNKINTNCRFVQVTKNWNVVWSYSSKNQKKNPKKYQWKITKKTSKTDKQKH